MSINSPLILVLTRDQELVSLLESRGKQLTFKTTADGRAGIHLALELIPDLIIAEQILPSKNGLQVCHAIKFDVRTKKVPFILLAKQKIEEFHTTGIEVEPDSLLIAPYNVDEMLDEIERLILFTGNSSQGNTVSVQKAFKLTEEDQSFISSIHTVMAKEFSNADFHVDEFAEKMYMSRMQLHRKIKALYDHSPGTHIRKYRLQKAAHLLQTTNKRISEISFACGFKQPAYFAKCFKEDYGSSPANFRK